MSQQKDKKITPRKLFVYGVVGLLLFGLPLMSYVYLSKGFKWRMEAQSELKDFGKVPEQPMVWNDGSHEDRIAGKLCVIYNFGQHADLTEANKSVLNIGEELIKQFGYKPESVRNDFRFVMVRSTESAEFKAFREAKKTAQLANWMPTGSVNTFGKILTDGFQYYCKSEGARPYPHYFAMTDTAGIIRRFYNADDKNEIDRMVQHIAIIIPKQFKK